MGTRLPRYIHSWETFINQLDPTRRRDKINEVEYEFSNGRVFRANPDIRGAYEPLDFDFSGAFSDDFNNLATENRE